MSVLGRTCVHKVEARVLPDVDLAQRGLRGALHAQYALVLLCAVAILARPQRVRHAVGGVGVRAGEVVRRVRLVRVASAPVRVL